MSVPASKMELFVHSTRPNAPYIHTRLDLILELRRGFPIGCYVWAVHWLYWNSSTGCQVTSLLCQNDIIIYCISAYSGTFGSLF